MKTSGFLFVVMLVLVPFGCQRNQQAISQSQENVLNYNVLQGSASPELQSALNNLAVQRLLLDVSIRPRAGAYLDSVLRQTAFTPAALVSLGLVGCKDDVYTIHCLVFNSADQRRMREITESHARILATALLSRRSEIEGVVKDYPPSDVDPRAILHIVLGCFSLDWDGLALTAEKGYRSPPSIVQRLFPRTIVHAWEPTELTRRGFYKGSHNSQYGNATLTSFGDHEIQPRRAFPDVLWNQDLYPDSLRLRLKELIRKSSAEALGRQVALIMLALRNGHKSVAELAVAVGLEEADVKHLAGLLEEFHYLAQHGDRYAACIPVLAASDSSIVRRLRVIGHEEMVHWCDTHYSRLHDELAALTPFRCGVDQADFFYLIWHDIFGAANRMLVESNLFADPYSSAYGARGIIPAVFESSLYSEP